MREVVPYFQDVLRILGDEIGAASITGLRVDVRAYQYGRLVCSLRYPDDSRLDVLLWANCADDVIDWPQYGFHYRDADDRLRFRFDNAPHHSDLANFPHHIHASDGRIHGALRPSVRAIADLIRVYLEGGRPFADDTWQERYRLTY